MLIHHLKDLIPCFSFCYLFLDSESFCSYSVTYFLCTNDASALNSAIEILSAIALSLVDELVHCDLLDFGEDLLEYDFFTNDDCLDSLSSDSSPCFN